MSTTIFSTAESQAEPSRYYYDYYHFQCITQLRVCVAPYIDRYGYGHAFVTIIMRFACACGFIFNMDFLWIEIALKTIGDNKTCTSLNCTRLERVCGRVCSLAHRTHTLIQMAGFDSKHNKHPSICAMSKFLCAYFAGDFSTWIFYVNHFALPPSLPPSVYLTGEHTSLNRKVCMIFWLIDLPIGCNLRAYSINQLATTLVECDIFWSASFPQKPRHLKSSHTHNILISKLTFNGTNRKKQYHFQRNLCLSVRIIQSQCELIHFNCLKISFHLFIWTS